MPNTHELLKTAAAALMEAGDGTYLLTVHDEIQSLVKVDMAEAEERLLAASKDRKIGTIAHVSGTGIASQTSLIAAITKRLKEGGIDVQVIDSAEASRAVRNAQQALAFGMIYGLSKPHAADMIEPVSPYSYERKTAPWGKKQRFKVR